MSMESSFRAEKTAKFAKLTLQACKSQKLGTSATLCVLSTTKTGTSLSVSETAVSSSSQVILNKKRSCTPTSKAKSGVLIRASILLFIQVVMTTRSAFGMFQNERFKSPSSSLIAMLLQRPVVLQPFQRCQPLSVHEQ